MGVAHHIESYLKNNEVNYALIEHPYSEGSFNTALAAKIDNHALAKGVLLRDEDFHYTLCILPSSHKILRHTLNQIFDRHMHLVEEDQLHDFFEDCEEGAIPALGAAYGLDVIWDEELLANEFVYMEAGDHVHLIRVSKDDFSRLMAETMHDHFSASRTKHYHPPVYIKHTYEMV